MPPDPLRGFILRALLWLPLCFAAWYGLAAIHAGVIGSLSRGAIDLFRPGLVTGLEQAGRELVFVTRILVHPAPGQSALVLPEVNPLLYTYGLAFFAALMLAARAKLWKLAVGVLLLLQAAGVGTIVTIVQFITFTVLIAGIALIIWSFALKNSVA